MSRSTLGFHGGRHYTEWVDDVRKLKRDGRNDDAVALLWNLVAAVEAEDNVKHHGVATWYYEHLAIIARKNGDLAGEVAVLERYTNRKKAPGSGSAKLAARLRTACNMLAARERTADATTTAAADAPVGCPTYGTVFDTAPTRSGTCKHCQKPFTAVTRDKVRTVPRPQL